MRDLFAMPLALLVSATCLLSTHASEGGDDLVKLAKSGADTPAIFAHIKASPIAYELSADEIMFLNDLGVPSNVIAYAIKEGKRKRSEPIPKNTTKSSPGFSELVQLLKAKAPEDAILKFIDLSKSAYDLTVDEVLFLQAAKCPASIIDRAFAHGKALRKAAGIATAPTPPVIPPPTPTAPPPVIGTLPPDQVGAPGFEQLLTLVKMGTDQDLVLGFINSPPTASYDLNTEQILALKAAGATPQLIQGALDVGKSTRDRALAARDSAVRESAATLDQNNLRSLMRNEPKTQFTLKNKAGQEFALNKWVQNTTTLFVLFENKQPLKTIVADASTTTAAEYKTEETKVEVTPQRTVSNNGTTETIPPVYEIRPKLICTSPEKVTYTYQGKPVLTHAIEYEYAAEKSAYIFKRGTAAIGSDEYTLTDARDASK